MKKETIIKYLTNQLSEAERKQFRDALEKDAALKSEFIRQKNIWALSKSMTQYGKLLEGKESSRFLFQLDKRKTEEKRHLKLVSQSRLYKLVASVAVIMMLASIGYVFVRNWNQAPDNSVLYTESYVPKGEKSELLLPDGTHLMVNADTRVRIPSNFSTTNRRLWIEGEAYFNVVSDSLNPFLLETPQINVQVLGTAFDLSCYKEEHEVKVVLEEGKVMFSGTNNSAVDGIVLRPGETGVYHKINGTLKVNKTVNALYTTGWKEGVFRFKNMPFYELINRLERQYNVVIEVEDEELLNERYTGEVNSETVRRVMQNFALATPFDVTFKGRYITVKKRKNFK